jgi:hypothetical protein
MKGHKSTTHKAMPRLRVGASLGLVMISLKLNFIIYYYLRLQVALAKRIAIREDLEQPGNALLH